MPGPKLEEKFFMQHSVRSLEQRGQCPVTGFEQTKLRFAMGLFNNIPRSPVKAE